MPQPEATPAAAATPPAAAAATPASNDNAKPAVDASTAGKTLRSFADLKARAKAQEAAKTTPAPAANDNAKPAAAANDNAKAKSAEDRELEALDRILREDERQKAEAKKLAAERAAWQAEREREKAELEIARAIKAARDKGDPLGLLRALGLTDADIYEGDQPFIYRLAEARTKGAQPISEQERIDAAIEQKLLAKASEQQKAEEARLTKEREEAQQRQAAAEQKLSTAKAAYGKNVAAIFAEGAAAKFPSIGKAIALGQRLGVAFDPAAAATEYALANLAHTNGAQMLTEEEALSDLEEFYAERFKEQPEPEKKPEPERLRATGISVNPSWQRQDGAPAAATPADLNGKFEALKRRFREQTRSA
jgi:hypothetical protein